MQADLADGDSNWFVCTNRLVVLLSGLSRDNFGSDVQYTFCYLCFRQQQKYQALKSTLVLTKKQLKMNSVVTLKLAKVKKTHCLDEFQRDSNHFGAKV